jgi:hypothetical protein
MVRGLSGQYARKDLLAFLDKCGLGERYTFFYLPCKEHRNVPAGFAFVNLHAPVDVLTLHASVKNGLWRECASDPNAKSIVVSYARFQGHDELARHFSASAVLHEQDPQKRPIFRPKANASGGSGAPKEMENAAQVGDTGGCAGSPKTQGRRSGGLPQGARAGAAPRSVPAPGQQLVSPSSLTAGKQQLPGSNLHCGSGGTGDFELHEALDRGAKEITAILMQQKLAGGASPKSVAAPKSVADPYAPKYVATSSFVKEKGRGQGKEQEGEGSSGSESGPSMNGFHPMTIGG